MIIRKFLLVKANIPGKPKMKGMSDYKESEHPRSPKGEWTDKPEKGQNKIPYKLKEDKLISLIEEKPSGGKKLFNYYFRKIRKNRYVVYSVNEKGYLEGEGILKIDNPEEFIKRQIKSRENENYRATNFDPAQKRDFYYKIRREWNESRKQIKLSEAIPKSLEPLAREARKYKSAEEFIKAQEKALEKKVGWKVISNAPDGRFGTKILEGGLDKKTAEFEAKYLKEHGQIVNIFPPKDKFTKSQLIDFYNQVTKGKTDKLNLKASNPGEKIYHDRDVVQGDIIEFQEPVFSAGSFHHGRSTAKHLGDRTVLAKVVKESYGDDVGLHTFSLEVIDSKGYEPHEKGKIIKRRGKTIYPCKVIDNVLDKDRVKLLEEKHERGKTSKTYLK